MRTRARAANTSHVMVNFITYSKTRRPQTKGGNERRYANHFFCWKMSDKRALKNMTAFLFPHQPPTPNHDTTSPCMRGPKQQTPARGLTPNLTPYRWHGANTGSRSAIHKTQRENVLSQRPVLWDHLNRHKDTSMQVKCILMCWKANPLEHINGKDLFWV